MKVQPITIGDCNKKAHRVWLEFTPKEADNGGYACSACICNLAAFRHIDIFQPTRPFLNRRDLASALSPGRAGTDSSRWAPDELSRRRAAAVVDVIFDSIAAALKKGEKVTLPIGTLEVVDRKRRPRRGWFLNRVRVIYVERKYIQFTPNEGCLDEPAVVGRQPLLRPLGALAAELKKNKEAIRDRYIESRLWLRR